MALCPPLSPQSLMTYWHQMTRLTIVTLRQRRRSMVAYPDQAEVIRAEAADLEADIRQEFGFYRKAQARLRILTTAPELPARRAA